MQKEQKNFAISLEQINKLAAYLGEQKYKESAHLIEMLGTLLGVERLEKPAPAPVPEVKAAE